MTRQPSRKPSKHGAGGHQTSVNFPKEMITWLDEMTEKVGINRSALVCLIVEDFMLSGKTIRLVVDHMGLPMSIDELVEASAEAISEQDQKKLDRLERNNQIMQMRLDGLSNREIATLKGIPYSTVYNVLREAKK